MVIFLRQVAAKFSEGEKLPNHNSEGSRNLQMYCMRKTERGGAAHSELHLG